MPLPSTARVQKSRPSRLAVAGLAVLVGGFSIVLGVFGTVAWEHAAVFLSYRPAEPSRLYAGPVVLSVGDPLSANELVELLDHVDYRAADGKRLPVGGFSRAGEKVRIHRRAFAVAPEQRSFSQAEITVKMRDGRVAGLEEGGREVEQVVLESPILHNFYAANLRDCRPIDIETLPDHVILPFLAAEDADFFHHPGFSPKGIARAAWVNLRRSEVVQGGSTITQQLARTLFLSNERTVARKVRESVLALGLELRYGKNELLEAYLNEIYLGTSGPVQLHGIGAASAAFFGKRPAELTLTEAATLAAMVASPARFDPRAHPERVRSRRDWVLRRLASLGWTGEREVRLATAEPVETHLTRLDRGAAPYFAALAAAEAQQDYGVRRLAGGGYELWSTLDWFQQRRAETAVRDGLQRIERAWEAGRSTRERPLQGALVSVDAQGGAIRAYVGGRDYGISQYDRLRQARRQAGRVFKPLVYAAAFSDRVVLPYELVEDVPIERREEYADWQPRNYDRRFHGTVAVSRALEHSYNAAAVRVALDTGLGRVRQLASDVGLSPHREVGPALALGAIDVAPLEMAGAYTVFASGGYHSKPHGLAAVFDARGARVPARVHRSSPRPLDENVSYQITRILQNVLIRGTGYTAYAMGLRDSLAGKTGTSNGQRDSWFAGYSSERVAVAWVGYDDNRPTRLTGSTGALPIWTEFMLATRPAEGHPGFTCPEDLVEVWVDPTTRLRATPFCPRGTLAVVYEFEVPEEPCWHAELYRDRDLYHQQFYPDAQLTDYSGEEQVEEGEESRPRRERILAGPGPRELGVIEPAVHRGGRDRADPSL